MKQPWPSVSACVCCAAEPGSPPQPSAEAGPSIPQHPPAVLCVRACAAHAAPAGLGHGAAAPSQGHPGVCPVPRARGAAGERRVWRRRRRDHVPHAPQRQQPQGRRRQGGGGGWHRPRDPFCAWQPPPAGMATGRTDWVVCARACAWRACTPCTCTRCHSPACVCRFSRTDMRTRACTHAHTPTHASAIAGAIPNYANLNCNCKCNCKCNCAHAHLQVLSDYSPLRLAFHDQDTKFMSAQVRGWMGGGGRGGPGGRG